MNRRHVLKRMALAGGGAILPLGRWGWALADARAAPRRLIVVMLRGAVDGLSVVVPYRETAYAASRPSIALASPGGDGGVIDLDGQFGLHPALAPLMPLWQAQRLAFVQASGSGDPSRSHFDAQRYMETATLGVATTTDGWMNRLVGVLPGPHGPTEAVSVGPTQPRILMGPQPATNMALGKNAAAPLPVDRPAVAEAFAQLYNGSDPLSQAYREGQASRRELLGDMQAEGMAPDPASEEQRKADNGAPPPDGFPQVAGRLAGLLRQDPGIRLAFVDLGGWDTHVNQGNGTGQLANHLAPLGAGLAALAQGLGPQLDETIVLVMSEFGRTVHENGNAGTDHGRGNVIWAMGGGIAGGKVHGRWPGLDASALYQNRDLAVTTDFRGVIGLVLERHLRLDDASLAAVIPEMPAADPALGRLLPA